MANKRPKPEEIVTKLRQVEVLMGQGMSRLDAIRQIGVVEQTYYRWRKQYGGMGVEQLKELKRLQKENEQLRRAGRAMVGVRRPRLCNGRNLRIADFRFQRSCGMPRKSALLKLQCSAVRPVKTRLRPRILFQLSSEAKLYLPCCRQLVNTKHCFRAWEQVAKVLAIWPERLCAFSPQVRQYCISRQPCFFHQHGWRNELLSKRCDIFRV